MRSDLIIVDSKRPRIRLLILAAVISAMLFGWIAVRLQIGNLLAEMTSTSDLNALDIADLAHRMAPSDPMATWLKAGVQKQTFTPESRDSAILLLEETVRLSPEDFRWWIELGRACEQAEKTEKAEAAFRHAVDIAPSYTFPHWQLGNFYLRQQRTDEAFAELKKATFNNDAYREQVFSLAWDYFDKDTAKLETLAADRPDVYTGLALFYAARGQAADALRIWNKLSDSDKKASPQISHVIAQGLFERRFFPQALEFSRQIGIDPDAQPQTINNAGFEKSVGMSEEFYFDWHIARVGKIDIASDSSVRHSGNRSLRIIFRNYVKPDLYNVGQTVVVEPGKSYTVRFWLRTENLRSVGGPQIEIVNGNDDKIIATTKAFSQGTNDWQEIVADFTAPVNCVGIVIRTTREFCGDACSIVGTIWYDDFEIEQR